MLWPHSSKLLRMFFLAFKGLVLHTLVMDFGIYRRFRCFNGSQEKTRPLDSDITYDNQTLPPLMHLNSPLQIYMISNVQYIWGSAIHFCCILCFPNQWPREAFLYIGMILACRSWCLQLTVNSYSSYSNVFFFWLYAQETDSDRFYWCRDGFLQIIVPKLWEALVAKAFSLSDQQMT